MEFATLEGVDWFNNHRRLLEPIGNIPPGEAEARYYGQIAGQVWPPDSNQIISEKSWAAHGALCAAGVIGTWIECGYS